jgi:hypothetical protein
VTAGLIFGSYHVLNGISEVIPACILGIGMGYLVYKTDSISTSMFFHAAANTCAVLLGGAFEMSASDGIPVWLHIIAFAGLCLSVILLRSLRAGTQSNENKDEIYEKDEIHKDEGADERAFLAGIVFLILSAIFLTAVGVLEILARLGIVK